MVGKVWWVISPILRSVVFFDPRLVNYVRSHNITRRFFLSTRQPHGGDIMEAGDYLQSGRCESYIGKNQSPVTRYYLMFVSSYEFSSVKWGGNF